MQTQISPNRAASIPYATMLPQAAFMVLFANFKFMFRGNPLKVKLIYHEGDLARAIEVGDFLYIEQNKLGNGNLAKERRAGKLILNIYNKKNMSKIAMVINGKVYRV